MLVVVILVGTAVRAFPTCMVRIGCSNHWRARYHTASECNMIRVQKTLQEEKLPLVCGSEEGAILLASTPLTR